MKIFTPKWQDFMYHAYVTNNWVQHLIYQMLGEKKTCRWLLQIQIEKETSTKMFTPFYIG